MKKYLLEIFNKFKNLRGMKRIYTYLLISLYIFIVIVSLVKVNYTTLSPGTITPVSSLITIEDSNNANKPIYTVSVYETRQVSIMQYWLSLLNPYIAISKFDPKIELSNKDEQYQGELMKKTSITNSIILAYNEAKKQNPLINIEYEFNGLVVVMINRLTDPDLHLGDVITAINGHDITSYNAYKAIVLALLEDEQVNDFSLSIIRKEEKQDISVSIYSEQTPNGKLRYLNFMAYEDYTIKNANPKYTEKKSDSYGPSGGLMQALAIYDAITNGDLTKGKKIMGTGTINVDGTIGAIGGIEQKIITANLYDADYFFVPRENYSDELKQYQSLKDPILKDIIQVDSFSDAINFLLNLEG